MPLKVLSSSEFYKIFHNRYSIEQVQEAVIFSFILQIFKKIVKVSGHFRQYWKSL